MFRLYLEGISISQFCGTKSLQLSLAGLPWHLAVLQKQDLHQGKGVAARNSQALTMDDQDVEEGLEDIGM